MVIGDDEFRYALYLLKHLSHYSRYIKQFHWKRMENEISINLTAHKSDVAAIGRGTFSNSIRMI